MNRRFLWPLNALSPQRYIFTMLLLLITCCCSAQADYEPAGIVYKDNSLKVELEYRINNTCLTQKNCKYRFRITGQPRGFRYINYIMKFYNCDNTITRQPVSLHIEELAGNSSQPSLVEDMNWTFAANRMYIAYEDVSTSGMPSTERTTRESLPVSAAAQGINGPGKADYGDNTVLEVKGGNLGLKAHWIWYTGQCGSKAIGTGKTVTVSPKENTTYYVRAESPTDTTACVSLVMAVNTLSRPADHIEGKTVICKGEKNVPLAVYGGKLGKGARWVWYQDSCPGNQIATGDQIQVSPLQNTRYFVRAEGVSNITDCRALAINLVNDRSTDPDKIKGNTNVCVGSAVQMEVVGGNLAGDADWHWYKGSVGAGNEVGRGNQLSVLPTSNATYLVRGEGACYTTSEKKLSVMVNSVSIQPYSIGISPIYLYTGNKVTLSVRGGQLGNNAAWTWYKRSCTHGRKIGEGQNITVRARRKTTYYVRAEGNCNTTGCASYTINPSRKFEFFNVGILPNFQSASSSATSYSVEDRINRALDQRSFGVTFGQMKKSGWYLRGKYSFLKTKSAYNSSNTMLMDYSSTEQYYEYNGKVAEKRIGATGGFIFGITQKWLFLTVGGGYGKRDLFWGINDISYLDGSHEEKWARNVNHSYEGVEGEIGIMIKCGILNIMVSGNAIFSSSKSKQEEHAAEPFIDLYTGIGFNF